MYPAAGGTGTKGQWYATRAKRVKPGLSSRVQLVAFAYENGLVR